MSIFIFYSFLMLKFLPMFLCEATADDLKNKLNVVIFFSHIDSKCASLEKDTLGFLNLHEATRIKHCAETANNLEQASETSNHKETGSAYCKELLKNSLISLTHYCHTVLKMKTAIASVSSKEVTNDIQEPEAPFHETNIGFYPEIPHKVKRSPTSSEMKKMQRKSDDNPMPLTSNQKSKGRNIITSAKHTEIFKIRVKRNEHEHAENGENNHQIKIISDNFSRKRNTKPSWDVLDVMKHIRYSFLGKMFEDTLQHQLKDDQEDLADITKLGKEKQDPGLFSMVKSTLTTLLEPPEASFIMVVFGGHLHEVKDKHSPLVQSIKHVIENTDSENTLFIVTGN